jgi:hypothetical protein
LALGELARSGGHMPGRPGLGDCVVDPAVARIAGELLDHGRPAASPAWARVNSSTLPGCIPLYQSRPSASKGAGPTTLAQRVTRLPSRAAYASARAPDGKSLPAQVAGYIRQIFCPRRHAAPRQPGGAAVAWPVGDQ